MINFITTLLGTLLGILLTRSPIRFCVYCWKSYIESSGSKHCCPHMVAYKGQKIDPRDWGDALRDIGEIGKLHNRWLNWLKSLTKNNKRE